ncbi:putative ribonuclease H-like domain-containing protein [Medicago truncatula]|uniref:Putative ribonuclease H-like domain-containing protein n=1 Tax=Medicago truncatula TaxID=3880 RepID=A0A396I469_MEDTR|nr:putative ribonuclease H-like domain-containing protein [Medicago truncatula]
MAAACWYRLSLPYSDAAEGLAILLGVEFAKDSSFRSVEANSDSTNVIEALNNRHTQYTYLGAIAMECTQLCSSFNNINFSHVGGV